MVNTPNDRHELRRRVKKRLMLVAPLCLCLLLLLDWTGITDGGFPSTWAEALVQVGINTVATTFFSVTFYFAIFYIYERFLDPKRAQQRIEGQK